MKTHEMTPRMAFFAYGIDGKSFFCKVVFENGCGSNTCAKWARDRHFDCGFIMFSVSGPFLDPSAILGRFLDIFLGIL